MIFPIFASLRPKQWTKNFLVFVAILFSKNELFFSYKAWLYSFVGFIVFCGLSGCVYILNDIIDINKDRLHHKKCNRPIASGLVGLNEAKSTLLIILFCSLIAAWNISPLFFSVSLGYFMLNFAYSFKLKQVIIVDSICIALGFALRAIAGVGSLHPISQDVYISKLLIVAIFMFAMLIAITEKRQEIENQEDENSLEKVKEQEKYSNKYIDQSTSILATSTIISYTLYMINAENISLFKAQHLIYTVPFMIYAVLRYLYLSQIIEDWNSSTDLILKDKPFIGCIIFWLITLTFILHYHT